ncbi:RNA ligase [Methylobacterium sp. C1]|uniref:RNA ligase n=1 Tax=Methylobacterium sp. C1 TaxID=1479019 RepID=UPI0008D9855C|nr:RNA ligase [Methylobacterium sp. C1]
MTEQAKVSHQAAAVHPARSLSFEALVAGLEKARTVGYVSRKVCPETGLHLYCYTQRCVYDHGWDAFSLMARGLIVDPSARSVVATPFPKFFNLGERGAPGSTDLPFEAFDKLDGSLIVAFRHPGRWRAATKGAFDSSQALWAQARLDAMDTSRLTPGTTYLFEAIYPETIIVIRYADAGLSLLAAYDADGREVPYDDLMTLAEDSLFAFKVVQRQAFVSIAAMVTRAAALPGDKEGFVIRFADGSRLKIKGAEYKRLHGLISRCTPLAVWDVLATGGDPAEMRKDLPEEFWDDFDEICSIIGNRYLSLLKRLLSAVEDVRNLSDKELGLRLSSMPADVRPFLFQHRKADTPEAKAKLTLAMLRTIRPTGNVLDGYVPSYAMTRVMAEAA